MSKIEWPDETNEVLDRLKAKIANILETDEQGKNDFERFMERIHATPDGSVTVSKEEAIELFALYIITKPAQDAIIKSE